MDNKPLGGGVSLGTPTIDKMFDINVDDMPKDKHYKKDFLDPHGALLDFIKELEAYGLIMTGLPSATETIVRVPTQEDKRGKKTGWYILYDGPMLAGSYGDFRKDDSNHTWCSVNKETMSSHQRVHFQNQMRAAREKRIAELKRIQENAAVAARSVWEGGKEIFNYLYLVNKKLRGMARVSQSDEYYKGWMMLPLLDEKEDIVSLQFISETGKKYFFSGGRIKGCYNAVEGSTDIIYIAEGHATALTINQATNNMCVVAWNAGNLTAVAAAIREKYPDAEIIITGDDDHWTSNNPGRSNAEQAAETVGGNAIFPEFKCVENKPTDFNDLLIQDGIVEVKKQVLVEGIWPDPTDAFSRFELPALPIGNIPSVLHPFVQENAEIMGVDPGILFSGALAACASAIDDAHKVQVKKRDKTWLESPRLWVAHVGPPSIKKSPCYVKIMKPHKKIEADWIRDDAELIVEYDLDVKIYKKKEQEYIKQSAKGEKIEKPLPPEKPRMRRSYVSDITVEELGNILVDNPRGILSYHDELSGFFGSFGVYKPGGGAKDRAVWLEGFNGGSKTIDRVGKGRIHVPNFSVCLMGGIQPEPMRNIARKMEDNGLLQRFLVQCSHDAHQGMDKELSYDATFGYETIIRNLIDLKVPDEAYQFDDNAHAVRANFFDYINKAQCNNGLPAPLRAHFGKLEGIFARMALTLHLIDCARDGLDPSMTIEAKTARQTEALLRNYFMPHAIHFYNTVILHEKRFSHAEWIANFILSRQLEVIKVRDITRAYNVLKSVESSEIQSVMELLTNYGWVEPKLKKKELKAKTWKVNPKIHSKFKDKAIAEKVRREIERENLAEMFAERTLAKGH